MSVIDVEGTETQRLKNQAALQLLQAWRTEDAQEQAEAWLGAARSSRRRLVNTGGRWCGVVEEDDCSIRNTLIKGELWKRR